MELLEESIISVLNQSFGDFKLVISNDNPSRTLLLENLRVPFDSRIEIVNHDVNLGEIGNLNWLLDYASTPYFTWLADDELLHPKFLEFMYLELTSKSGCRVAYCNYELGETPTLNFFNNKVVDVFEIFDSNSFLVNYASRELKLIGCYGLFDILLLKAIGGFHQLGTGDSPFSDVLIPVLLSEKSTIHYTHVSLIFLRTHSSSVSWSTTDLQSYLSAESDFLKYSQRVIDLLPNEARRSVYKAFRNWFQDDHFTVIRRDYNQKIHINLARFIFSERRNYNLFRKSDLGMRLNAEFFMRVIGKFILMTKEWLFPNAKQRIKAIFQQKV